MVLLLYHYEDILISEHKKQLFDQTHTVIASEKLGGGGGYVVDIFCFSADNTFEL